MKQLILISLACLFGSCAKEGSSSDESKTSQINPEEKILSGRIGNPQDQPGLQEGQFVALIYDEDVENNIALSYEDPNNHPLDPLPPSSISSSLNDAANYYLENKNRNPDDVKIDIDKIINHLEERLKKVASRAEKDELENKVKILKRALVKLHLLGLIKKDLIIPKFGDHISGDQISQEKLIILCNKKDLIIASVKLRVEKILYVFASIEEKLNDSNRPDKENIIKILAELSAQLSKKSVDFENAFTEKCADVPSGQP